MTSAGCLALSEANRRCPVPSQEEVLGLLYGVAPSQGGQGGQQQEGRGQEWQWGCKEVEEDKEDDGDQEDGEDKEVEANKATEEDKEEHETDEVDKENKEEETDREYTC